MLDCKPVITRGELKPVAVNDPGEDVATYDLPTTVPGVNEIEADPLLYARPMGEFVAVTEVTVEAIPPVCSHPYVAPE